MPSRSASVDALNKAVVVQLVLQFVLQVQVSIERDNWSLLELLEVLVSLVEMVSEETSLACPKDFNRILNKDRMHELYPYNSWQNIVHIHIVVVQLDVLFDYASFQFCTNFLHTNIEVIEPTTRTRMRR